MKKMKIVKGDLLGLAHQGKFDVIIHGCNCLNIMGAGIAKQIKEKYPSAYKADLSTEKGDKWKLGTFTAAHMPRKNMRHLVVVNAYIQFDIKGPKPRVDYEALEQCFLTIKHRFGNQGLRFGYPKLGAGLGGGDWEVISKIIDNELEGEDHTLVIWEKNDGD